MPKQATPTCAPLGGQGCRLCRRPRLLYREPRPSVGRLTRTPTRSAATANSLRRSETGLKATTDSRTINRQVQVRVSVKCRCINLKRVQNTAHITMRSRSGHAPIAGQKVSHRVSWTRADSTYSHAHPATTRCPEILDETADLAPFADASTVTQEEARARACTKDEAVSHQTNKVHHPLSGLSWRALFYGVMPSAGRGCSGW